MSDFDDQLRAALEGGAEQAPGTTGLADAARRRHRVRRRRTVVAGAVAAVVAVAVPTAVIAGGGDGGRPAPVAPSPGPEWAKEIQVTCVEGHRWPVSAMDGGSGGEVDEGEVRAAFANLLQEAPMDAPEAIREQGFEDVPYVLLSGDDDEAVVGVGPWSVDGPGAGADYLLLERRQADLRAASWGDCELSTALPDGQWQVRFKAPRGGVDPTTTDVTVLVNEVSCAGARDPRPFLAEPVVAEHDDRVMVTMSSEEMRGAATCMMGPSVPVKIHLDEPLGDRALYDAGTWPPTPIKVASGDDEEVDLRTRTHDGVTFAIPADWHGAFRGWEVTYRPDSFSTPMTTGLSFQRVGDYNPEGEPGDVRLADDRGVPLWTGFVEVGDWIVVVATPEEALTRRLLDSVALESSSWPCDPNMGNPQPRASCPDEPDTGWLTLDETGQLWFQPFRTLHSNAEGRAYAEEHDLEFPFSGDYYDAAAGEPRPFETALDDVSVCTGAIQVRTNRASARDGEVDCQAFLEALEERPGVRIPVAIWSGSGVPVLQLSDLYRP